MAKKQQWAEITMEPAIQVIRSKSRSNLSPPQPTPLCPGCGSGFHQGAMPRLQPDMSCMQASWSSSKGMQTKTIISTTVTTIHHGCPDLTSPGQQPPQINASQAGHRNPVEPAPTINIHVSSLNGNANITLTDSGADISVAGKAALRSLGEHEDNLLPS